MPIEKGPITVVTSVVIVVSIIIGYLMWDLYDVSNGTTDDDFEVFAQNGTLQIGNVYNSPSTIKTTDPVTFYCTVKGLPQNYTIRFKSTINATSGGTTMQSGPYQKVRGDDFKNNKWFTNIGTGYYKITIYAANWMDVDDIENEPILLETPEIPLTIS